MKFNDKLIIRHIVRFLFVSGLIIAIGYSFYKESVFISTRWPFQFFGTGITLGIAYATFSTNNYRTAIGILLLWYIVFTGFLFEHNSWIFILNGTYIALTSAALYLYLIIIKKTFASNNIVRVIISGLLFGITNSLIILLLALFSSHFVFNNLSILLQPMLLNLRIGIIIGILTGIGINLTDLFIKSFLT